MVKKYGVLLQEYDGSLSASSIVFDKVEMWVRILNLPIGWMNRDKGSRVMDMIGKVVSMDVDADGKASGAFLRARVAIDIDKPFRRGILLRLKRREEPKWFKVQYEKLPYICFSCGKLGHTDLECPTPAVRNEEGKLPYDVQLRAPEEKRRRLQSFVGATAETFGSGSSSGFYHTRQSNQSGDQSSRTGSRYSDSVMGESEEQEVQSPLKEDRVDVARRNNEGGQGASRKLDMIDEEGRRPGPRKRKSKGATLATHTPDLNIPVDGSSALVPAGLVSSRVNQMDPGAESGGSMIETLKKQKRGANNNARSAAAAESSPRRAQ